ncbi:MAG: TonB-dependent receptor [Vicinamibacterales bacterium]
MKLPLSIAVRTTAVLTSCALLLVSPLARAQQTPAPRGESSTDQPPAGTSPKTAPDAPKTLPTVTVTSTTIDDRFDSSSESDVPSRVNAVSGKEIEEQHIRNLQQALQAIPGVTSDVQGGGEDVKIKFRGVENQRFMGEKPGVAIIIDGVPVYERTGRPNIDLDNIDSVKVIKGGASYLFGEDALAGAVVITTKRGTSNRGVSGEFDAGSYGYQRKSGRVGFAKPWGTGFVQAVERGGDDYYFQSAYKTTSATGSVRAYIGETGDLTFGFEKANRLRDKHGSVTGLTQAAVDPRGVSGRDYTRKYNVDLDRFNVTYANSGASKNRNLLAVAYQYRDHTTFWSAPLRFNAAGGSVTSPDAYQNDNDYRQTQRGVKLEARGGRGAWGVLGGAEYKHNSYFNDTKALDSFRTSPVGAVTLLGTQLSSDTTVENTVAAYGEAKWSPVPALAITTNARYDGIHIDYSAPPVAGNGNRTIGEAKRFNVGSWRVGATYKLSRVVELYGAGSTGFRAPTADQLYRGDQTIVANVLNNPDLKPEHSLSVEGGVRSNSLMFGRASTLEATVFLIDRKDFILDTNGQYSPNNPNFVTRYENIGGARHRGLELAFKVAPVAPVTVELAYSYLNAYFTQYDQYFMALGNQFGTYVASPSLLTRPAQQFTIAAYNNTGNDVPRVSPHQANLRVKTEPYHGVRATLETDYRATAWADEINVVKWPGRTIQNIQLDWESRKGWIPVAANSVLSLFVRADNVFNTRYFMTMRGIGDSQSYGTGFAYDGIYNAEDPSLIVAPGRIVTAGLAIRF